MQKKTRNLLQPEATGPMMVSAVKTAKLHVETFSACLGVGQQQCISSMEVICGISLWEGKSIMLHHSSHLSGQRVNKQFFLFSLAAAFKFVFHN